MVAECAEVTQRAAARTERARAGIESARKRQEEAVAEQQKAVAQQEAAIARSERHFTRTQAIHEETVQMFQDFMRRADENQEWGKRVFAELADQRDERRALIEALLEVIDRLPPPPPHLRSA